MDTSEQYIKMCDCPEVQEHSRHDGGGHFYAWRSPHFKKQVHVDSYPGGKGTSVWLPRQDQIQEMLRQKVNDWDCLEKFNRPFQMIYWLNEFRDLYYLREHEITSMEQLWLAFYMHDKHEKKWNGKKWVA